MYKIYSGSPLMWELHSHSATAEFQDEKEDYERKSHAAQNFYVTSHAPKTVPPQHKYNKDSRKYMCEKSKHEHINYLVTMMLKQQY